MDSSEGTGFSGFSRVEGVSSAPICLTLWHPTILTVKYFGLMEGEPDYQLPRVFHAFRLDKPLEPSFPEIPFFIPRNTLYLALLRTGSSKQKVHHVAN